MQNWPNKIVAATQATKALGGSIYEMDDRDHYAVIIASAESNEYTGFAHEIPATVQRANAAFIVEAVNNYAALLSRVEELTKALEQSKAAMLRIRTASIAGCEEGYGRPEKWGDELFQSHGPVTAAIKEIDRLLALSLEGRGGAT